MGSLPPRDEPPQKRRRVELEQPPPRKRGVKDCLLYQVSPIVQKAVAGLSFDAYHVKALAIKTITILSTRKSFRQRWDETDGYLEPQDLEDIALQARDVVRKLARGSEFRTVPSSEEPEPDPEPRPPPQLVPPPRPTVKQAQQTESLKQQETSIAYDLPPAEPPQALELLTPQPLQALELPQHVERRPYKPRERREPKPQNRFYLLHKLSHRPYLPARDREAIEDGTKKPVNISTTTTTTTSTNASTNASTTTSKDVTSKSVVYHVDFSPEEIAEITEQISYVVNKRLPATREELMRQIVQGSLPIIDGRTKGDMNAFVADLYEGLTADIPRVLSYSLEPVSEETKRREGQLRRTSRLSSLLMAREMEGNRGFHRTRQYLNFQNEFKTLREDDFQMVAEFIGCAGDITTGAWISNESFLCGTTTHSDTHNQQYNRPGNLLLCSTAKGTLCAFPDHRIPRPRVEKGENSTDAMRQSQEPWLYSSVVSSDYSAENGLAFTSSFDKTVRVWKIDSDGRHMEAIATWHHTANVNFVTAAKDSSGRVATAADSLADAVRVYTVEKGNEANSTYQSFSCSRTDAEGSDKWTYFPATMQWGRAKGCQHLLLVGYSPRSLTGDDLDIPEDKRNSGEIILWDADQGQRIPVMTASTANVFEVAWHPILHRFLVATTPTVHVSHRIKTQVHVFQRDKERLGGDGYTQFQALDCYASDINELTFVPNSLGHAYVTAACTDGKVYVWDTACGDKPIHTLKHGKPTEEYYGDREKEDTGVKFTAWSTTLDRFYTGSSDGVVKVWNVRRLKKPFVRDILTAHGPISWGGFSPDNSKLAIGDATGRCFILSVDERDIPESHIRTLLDNTQRIRRPMPLILHPEPAPPGTATDDDEMQIDSEVEDDEETYTRRTYLDTGLLRLTGNPVIGAVQGPLYPSSNLFRREAHLNEDPSAPLLAEFERLQKESEAASIGGRRRSLRRVKNPSPPDERLKSIHNKNINRDLDLEKLERTELDDLVRAGALLNIEEDWGFSYEETEL